MKNRLILAAAALCLSLYSTGCVSDNVNACFTTASDIYDVGEDILFQSCAINAVEVEWNMGDGTTYEGISSPTHSYDAEGSYTVTQTVSRRKTTNTNTEVITIGSRYISSIEITALPSTDGQGNPWDAGDNADVYVVAVPASGSSAGYTSDVNSNVGITPPYQTTPSPASVKLTREVWNFYLLDDDGASADTMATWTVDIAAAEPNTPITLAGTNVGLKLTFYLQ